MQKWLCLILAVLLTLCLCGCDPVPEAATTTPTTTTTAAAASQTKGEGLKKFALAYSYDDTLDPFSATTEVNCRLTGLLYEGLVELDGNLAPQPVLASSVKKSDATHLTAVLRKGATFSDGSAVTAADVTASFYEAKRSERYRLLLSNVTAATAKGRRVVFTLSAADPNGAACLSFPIIKRGTQTSRKGKAPVGTGPYRLRSTDNGARLVRNPNHEQKAAFATVELRHLPNRTSRAYGLASGDITFDYDDLSEGKTSRMTGSTQTVTMNALVYLGVNSNRPHLNNPAVRRALSMVLNRSAIINSAYAKQATPSDAPFHPGWTKMSKLAKEPKRKIAAAVDLLKEADCERLELELIYSTERPDRAKVADAVRLQMKTGGVSVTVVPLPEAEYRKRLKAGQYDLYVGEIRLTADHSLRPLLGGGDASYGIDRKGAAATAYRRYLSGDSKLKEFVTAFAEDMPYIPLCWRDGLATYDRRLSVVTPNGYNPFSGFANWK